MDWQGKRLDVALTKKQVENSPNDDTHRPVSRQYETEYLGYYGYPYYWGGPFLWGPGAYPSGLSNPIATPKDALAEKIRRESMDSHLRSTGAVTGYHIEAEDGEIGHVAGFWWRTKPGPSATLMCERKIGGRARRYWSLPVDSEGELGQIQSVRRSLAGCYQKRAGVRRVCADHS